MFPHFSDLTPRPPDTSAPPTSRQQGGLDKMAQMAGKTKAALDGCGSAGKLRINLSV